MIRFSENDRDVEFFLELREKLDKFPVTKEQAQKALDRSLYTVVVYDGDRKIAFGRLVGDGFISASLQDIMVVSDLKKKGIGRMLIKHLVEYLEGYMLPGTRLNLSLMAVEGSEGFYEKCGFIKRPAGNGMGNGFTKVLIKA